MSDTLTAAIPGTVGVGGASLASHSDAGRSAGRAAAGVVKRLGAGAVGGMHHLIASVPWARRRSSG